MRQNKKEKYRCKSHCWLPPDLIESEPFLNLSGKIAMFCLIRFHQKAFKKKLKHQKRNAFVVTNNGEITFPYGEAKRFGIPSTLFRRVIRELVEDKGFIDISDYGNWYKKEPTKYSISERWKNYGTDEYKAAEIERRLPKGKGFQPENELWKRKK